VPASIKKRPWQIWALIGLSLLMVIACAPNLKTSDNSKHTLSPIPEGASDVVSIADNEFAEAESETKSASPEDFHFSQDPNPYYFNPFPGIGEVDEEKQLRVEIHARFSSRFGWATELDINLLAAARELARYVLEYGQTPPESLIRESMLWAGVGEVAPVFFIQGRMAGNQDLSSDTSDTSLDSWVIGLRRDLGINRIAVGVVQALSQESNAELEVRVVLGVKRSIELDAFSKETPFENRFIARGRCLDSNCKLKTFIRFLDEPVHEGKVENTKNGFLFEVLLPPAPAIYFLDVTDDQNGQHRVLISFPIYNQMPIPSVWASPANREQTGCSDSSSCSVALMNAINTIRTEGDKIPLLSNSVIITTAQAHAEDMLLNHYNSVYDREGRSAKVRLTENGALVLQAGELVSGAYSLSALIRQFKTSPSQTVFIQTDGFSHIGCGVAIRHSANRDYLAMSCILATLIDSRSGDDLANAIWTRLESLRKSAGKSVFKTEPELRDIAERGISRLIENPEKSKEIQADVSEQLSWTDFVKGRSRFGVFTIYTVDQLDLHPIVQELIHSRFNHLVLGIRKLASPNDKINGIFIYYIAYE
jgi:uncharacterized protein YkwD